MAILLLLLCFVTAASVAGTQPCSAPSFFDITRVTLSASVRAAYSLFGHAFACCVDR